jgi:NADH-quinone oxidoreductase subunit H
MSDWLLGFSLLIIKLALVLGLIGLVAAYLVLIERRLLGRFQARLGPNRAGWQGALQSFADGIKVLLKEHLIPDGADRFLFMLAPVVVAGGALLIFVVVPFGEGFTIRGRPVPMVFTDLNVGLLYTIAITTVAIYGVFLAGWSSNSLYSLFGGIRGAAQMISYELALGLSLVPVVMMAGSFSLVQIVNAQAAYPFILVQPVGFVIFLISTMAEAHRLPFDMPEAENELMGGYHTEYSGMAFGLFYVGEYVKMLAFGSLLAVFFLGGWHGPLLPGVVWFALKVMLVPFFLIWARASHPRFRYDQLMALGWKVLIPVALLNIVVTGGVMLLMG